MPEEETPLVGLDAVPSSPRAAHHTGTRESTYLERDVEAVLVPAGTSVTLPAGSRVTITQELGGDFTVMTGWGYLAVIRGEDADALGREAPAAPAASASEGTFSEEAVWAQLRTVYDPEIPVNVVDLGLIYGVEAAPLSEGGHRVAVRMTLTAPGCGMSPVLVEDVRRKVGAVPSVKEVCVDVVFDPPWNRSMMSEAAQLELGLF